MNSPVFSTKAYLLQRKDVQISIFHILNEEPHVEHGWGKLSNKEILGLLEIALQQLEKRRLIKKRLISRQAFFIKCFVIKNLEI